MFKAEQESAILSLKEAGTRRIAAIKGEGIQIVLEVSPVRESQSNADIENAVRQVQGHLG